MRCKGGMLMLAIACASSACAFVCFSAFMGLTPFLRFCVFVSASFLYLLVSPCSISKIGVRCNYLPLKKIKKFGRDMRFALVFIGFSVSTWKQADGGNSELYHK